MQITYVIIVAIVAYVFGAITKAFVDSVPNRLIPLQNVIIGFVSAFICYFCGIENDMLQAIVLCLAATMGAGGIADLVKLLKKGE